jgi:glycosyltransferase involved in cell wall biosynthesis
VTAVSEPESHFPNAAKWTLHHPERDITQRESQPRVEVSIPVFNEERFVRPTIEALHAAFSGAGLEVALSIVEDGSTDGTLAEIRKVQKLFPKVASRHSDEKLGRGRALREHWIHSDAEILAFVDADLATGPDAVVEAVRLAMRGADVVTGSRYLPRSIVRRPPLRRAVSEAYNWILRRIFQDGISDHQCGLKAFRRDALARLIPFTNEDTWFWDTEVLVLAKLAGFRVVEMPVRWQEHKVDRTQPRRLLHDIYLHGTGIIRLSSKVQSDLQRMVASSKSGHSSRVFRATLEPGSAPHDRSL